jgi:hypothetical protein
MAKRNPDVAAEVRRIESRVRSVEATERMILTVKDQQLRNAEKLRRLAILISEGSGEGLKEYLRWMQRRKKLSQMLKTLKPFHNLKPLPKRVTTWLARTGRAHKK